MKPLWSGAWPGASKNTTFNLAPRTPIRNIPTPHSNTSRYIAGAHGETGGWNAGSDVIMFKTRTISSYPAYTYASWYHRADDAWTFGLGDPKDDNYKTWDFSAGSEPYSGNEWYLELRTTPSSRTARTAWHGIGLPDGDSSNWYWDEAVNPTAGAWAKVELEIKYSNQRDGYIKLWENGVLRIDYTGTTDKYPGTTRSEGIGGYARDNGSANNYRYFADVYLDYTTQRVVLANNSNLANATVVETQVPTGWNGNSITTRTNLGKFTAGQTAYLFVFDANGTHNTAGYAVSVGGGSVKRPNPATNVSAQ